MITLPLFPLGRVVFPCEPVPLHIFEERYKALVGDCMSRTGAGESGEFTMFLSANDEMAKVGSSLKITQVLREYPDGRMDILAVGQRRCRLHQRQETDSYAVSEVEWFPDVDSDWDETLATTVFAKHRELIEHFSGETPEENDYVGQRSLSFLIAPSCALSTNDRQGLLELPTENERLIRLDVHLDAVLEQARTMHQAGRSILSEWALHRALNQREKL